MHELKIFAGAAAVIITFIVVFGWAISTFAYEDPIQVREVDGKEIVCVKGEDAWDCKITEDLNDLD